MANKSRPSDFYFSPEGKMHELQRERVLVLFGGQRALLMQLAHPLVNQGVLDYSSVRKNPFKRLTRTIELTHTLIFGTNEEVNAAAEKINRVHKAVKGNLNHAVGAHQTGASYHAQNPELLMWVWATLIDTGVAVYEKFIRNLSDSEKESYYQESKKLLPPLGGNIESTPATFKDLGTYLTTMYKSKKVSVSEEAKKELAPYLLLKKPALLKLPLLPLSIPLAKITIGLLPEELRKQYGLSWTKTDQKMFDAFAAVSRKMHTSKLSKLIPDNIRFSNHYRKALQKYIKDGNTLEKKTT